MVARPTDSRDLSLAKLELIDPVAVQDSRSHRARLWSMFLPVVDKKGWNQVEMLRLCDLCCEVVPSLLIPPSLSIAHFSTHFARDAEPTFDDGDGSTRAQRRPASRGGGQHVCVLTRSACASPDRSGHQPGSLCNTAEATPLVPNEHFAGPFGWSGASRGFSRGHAYVAVHAAISRALRQRRSG